MEVPHAKSAWMGTEDAWLVAASIQPAFVMAVAMAAASNH